MKNSDAGVPGTLHRGRAIWVYQALDLIAVSGVGPRIERLGGCGPDNSCLSLPGVRIDQCPG